MPRPRLPAAVRHLLLLAPLLLGAGCALNTTYGSGPPPMGERFQAAYAYYKRQVGPGAFAVSADEQQFGMAVCPEYGGCRTNGSNDAVRVCQQRCYLYDIGGQVVWRTHLPAPPDIRFPLDRGQSAT